MKKQSSDSGIISQIAAPLFIHSSNIYWEWARLLNSGNGRKKTYANFNLAGMPFYYQIIKNNRRILAMAKIKLIEIGMDDPLERLYYERQIHRKKAYDAKRRMIYMRNRRRLATSAACQMG